MKTLLIGSLLAFAAQAKSVDLSKSSFEWKASKVTGDSHSGPISMKAASLENGKGVFVADLNSIDVTDLSGEWREKFLNHVKSNDFFEVGKYPTAKLEIEKIDDKNLYGQLTVKDKTQKVTIPYLKKGKTLSGEFSFDRTDFGIIYGSGSFFKNLGDKMINDKVRLKFKVVTK